MTPKPKRIHLACNAHLDPVWLWTWQEGASEAVATFRVAADFCEQHDHFVFNHNEALLYDWVERYDPAVFKRILKLVDAGRWHIAGGAWLQPDVNGPSGESHIRQFLHGLHYFRSRFGKRPTTAYNFDPFGHPEGFAQLLAGSGFDSYVFCRPDWGTHELPVGAFRWTDRSGASVLARRSDDHYNTAPRSGETVAVKLGKFLEHFADEPVTMILWGIGNHGGGPSRKDWDALQRFIKDHPQFEWLHSTPDAFFNDVRRSGHVLPTVSGEIENSFPGCYTSMSRLKRANRAAEAMLARVERLASLAWWAGREAYPADELRAVWRDVLFNQFHDILPGSGIVDAERDALHKYGGAMDRLDRLWHEALVALVQDQPEARGEQTPVWVVNPHGYAVSTSVEIECFLGHHHPRNPEIAVRRGGRNVRFERIAPRHRTGSTQTVRFVTPVKLDAFEIARIDVAPLKARTNKDAPMPPATRKHLRLTAKGTTVTINPRTGLIDHLAFARQQPSVVGRGALQPVMMNDLDHSWTCGDPTGINKPGDILSQAPGWSTYDEAFRLASADKVAELSPPPEDKWRKRKRTAAKPVRIVEHGPLRTTVEAVFVCGPSALVRQYVFDRQYGRLELRDLVFMNHRDRTLKLWIPLAGEAQRTFSEAAYSVVERQPTDTHLDQPNQRWVAAQSRGGNWLGVAGTGSFAHSFCGGVLAINVLRSPAYSSFNLRPDNPHHAGRFQPRQDQGEHEMRYALLGGRRFREQGMHEAADLLNLPPHHATWFPAGSKRANLPRFSCEPSHVRVAALKQSEDGKALIVRLQEQAGRSAKVKLSVDGKRSSPIDVAAWSLTTVRIARHGGKLTTRHVNHVEGL